MMPRSPLSKLALTILLVALALTACPAPGGQKPPPPPTHKSQLHEVALATLRAEADRGRQALVREELDRYVEHNLLFSATDLPDTDRRLLGKLLDAAKVVDELNMLQIDPKMLEYAATIQEEGTQDDKRLLLRNHAPWCLDSGDVRCNALQSLPARAPGATAWPEGFSESDVAALTKHPDHVALLSPFTLVRRRAGKLLAEPMIDDPLLGPRIKRLSALLTEASKLARDASLKTFLAARAKALLSRAAYPYDESDLAWIAADGEWEVTVGPYETYRSPHRIKARFGMYIGQRDAEATGELSAYARELQWMEDQLAQLVGAKLYKARTISARTAISAIRLVMAAGDARRARGAVSAYHLPNVGKAVEQGLTKKVLLINHLHTLHSLLNQRAKAVLDDAQLKYVTAKAAVDNASLHEFCHGFGAHRGMAIEVGGKPTTVGAALGDLTLTMEELKAGAQALWLAGKLRHRRKVTEQMLRERYVTALVHYVGRLQDDLSLPHTQAATIILGSLLEAGAARYDQASGRWQLSFSRMERALAALTRTVATIQLSGDRAGAEKLLARSVRSHGSGHTLVDALALIRARDEHAFTAAGIKPYVFTYEVANVEKRTPAKR